MLDNIAFVHYREGGTFLEPVNLLSLYFFFIRMKLTLLF